MVFVVEEIRQYLKNVGNPNLNNIIKI